MKRYIVLIFPILFISCSNKQEKTIRFTEEQVASLQLGSTKILNVETDSVFTVDLNPFLKEQSFDFGSLVKEVKLIPLETTDEGLLDAIYKVIVTDSNIYVHDRFKGGGLVIFDNEGKFIKRIPNGKGPGELLRLYDIDYDNHKNELVAYQHSYLLFFSPSGQYIQQQRLPFMFHKFSVTPEGYVFKTVVNQKNPHLGIWEDYSLLISDKYFKLISIGLPWQPSGVNYEARNYLYNNNNLHVTHKFNDTIYQYISSSDLLKARYVIQFADKKLPERYTKGTFVEFENAIRQNDYYFHIGEYLDTKSHHLFSLDNWYKRVQAIIYRDKITGNLIRGTSADYDPNEIPPIAFPQMAFGDYFISWYNPSKNDLFSSNSSIISEEDKLKVKGLTENDNPVLVQFKLKNF